MHQSLRLIFNTEEDSNKRYSHTSHTGRTTAESKDRPGTLFKMFEKNSSN